MKFNQMIGNVEMFKIESQSILVGKILVDKLTNWLMLIIKAIFDEYHIF